MQTKFPVAMAAFVALLAAPVYSAAETLYSIDADSNLVEIDQSNATANVVTNLGIGRVEALAASANGLFAINEANELYRVFNDGADLIGSLNLASGTATGATFGLGGELLVNVQDGINSGLYIVNQGTGKANLQGNVTLDGDGFDGVEALTQVPDFPAVGPISRTLLATTALPNNENFPEDIVVINRTPGANPVGAALDVITGPGVALEDIFNNAGLTGANAKITGLSFKENKDLFAFDSIANRLFIADAVAGVGFQFGVVGTVDRELFSLAFANEDVIVREPNPSIVPLPATAFLLLSGIAGLGITRAARRRSAA